uniref:Uncharacterized protein n=1 Tax=Knipowitschia caucasica TaxID=637954 RepID=A0AAV2LE23_KNICA
MLSVTQSPPLHTSNTFTAPLPHFLFNKGQNKTQKCIQSPQQIYSGHKIGIGHEIYSGHKIYSSQQISTTARACTGSSQVE